MPQPIHITGGYAYSLQWLKEASMKSNNKNFEENMAKEIFDVVHANPCYSLTKKSEMCKEILESRMYVRSFKKFKKK